LLSNKGLIASRIAHGVPLGGELELVDGGTLAHSFAGRKPISSNVAGSLRPLPSRCISQ
jgi:recombination protein RecR